MGDEYNLPAYRSRFFHHMPSWEKLEKLGDHIYLPKNHYIAIPGDRAKYCYLLLEGRVISLELTQEGTEHIFNVFEEGSIFLESNVLANYEVDVYFQTIAPTELVRITAQALREAMMHDEDILQLVFDSFSSKYYSAMDQLRENYNHDALWKVYNMLLLLADGIGKPYYGDWVMIDMKITQQMIGSMLGMNRITVSRVLKELREKEMLLLINNAYYCVRKEDIQERQSDET
ncbi:MAG: Crp/Fnr family transcriptional regulator [Clostridia bacterium]|nr:Crp/Fnr family transcriptional regulator [Clostridia bacterium]